MTWSKPHSRNAVAARARPVCVRTRTGRRRLAAAEPPSEPAVRVARPRGRAKWRLQVRDLEHGDTLTLTLHRLPWPARYVAAQGGLSACSAQAGEFSAAQIGRTIARLLTDAA